MPKKSVFATIGRHCFPRDPKEIAMFWIQRKVVELHDILKKAERQGHIHLEDFSLTYAFTRGVNVEQRGNTLYTSI